MAATNPTLMSPHDRDIAESSALLQPPKGIPEIQYPAELVERIRAETVDAFLRLPHGGLEIAGILFGTRLEHAVQLTASRPIACEHAGGPSLTLSNRDADQLAKRLSEASTDPALNGLEAVGWYVSHTRRPFTIAESDLVVFDRFFPNPLQLTAVVRPETTGVARFRIFVRDEDACIDPEAPALEFTAHPSPTRLKPESPAVPPRDPSRNESQDPDSRSLRDENWGVPFEPPAADHAAVGQVTVGQVRIGNSTLIVAALVLALLIAVGALWFYFQPLRTRPLPLRVNESGQQLRITWDPRAVVIERAKYGTLAIRDLDGSPVSISLAPEILRTGSVIYSKPSDRVEIRLKLVDDRQHVSESIVYFLGRERQPPGVEAAPIVTQAPPRALPPLQPAQNEIAKPARPIPEKPAQTEPAKAGAAPLGTRTFTTPPARTTAPSAPLAAVIEPPKIPLAQAQPAAPLVGSLHPELSVPPAPGVVEKPKTEALQTDVPKQKPAPVSGRLIWTGDLHKGAVLKITNRGASMGALNGALPGVPVKVSVHAGELLDGAIAIYSGDPNTRQSAEAPSRHNGWNVTLYKFDPKRAHDVVVMDAPAQANDWKQLVLKSVNRTTIIVIDWQQTAN